MTGLSTFDSTVQKSIKLINQVQEEAHIDDTHKAFQVMRATLQTLRDRLTVEEAAHLGAQLPNLIAGYYYEGWKPGSTPKKYRNRDEFFDQINNYMQNVDPSMDIEHSVRGIFTVLTQNVSAGQIDDIIHSLPEEVRELWPQEKVSH